MESVWDNATFGNISMANSSHINCTLTENGTYLEEGCLNVGKLQTNLIEMMNNWILYIS